MEPKSWIYYLINIVAFIAVIYSVTSLGCTYNCHYVYKSDYTIEEVCK